MRRCDGIIIAGTTEGRQIIGALNRRGLKLAVTVATALGRQVLDGVDGIEDTEVFEGRRDEQGFCELFDRLAPVLVVDASHPFAVEVSRTVRAACAAKNVRYIRYVRPEGQGTALEKQSSEVLLPVHEAADAHEAAAFIRRIPGNILLTTGANTVRIYADEIPDFYERCYIRVLDTELSRKGCRAAGVPEAHVIAADPPFSCDDNVKLIERFSIKALVSKDSGTAGGLPEKLAAARQTGIPVILIRRPEAESGADSGDYVCVGSVEALVALVEPMMVDLNTAETDNQPAKADDALAETEVRG